MKRATRVLIVGLLLIAGRAAFALDSMPTDRDWDALPAPGDDAGRATLLSAARALGDRTIHFAGVAIDRGELTLLARTPLGEPLVRSARERLGRPVDLPDFLRFLDDLVYAWNDGGATSEIWVPSGRARNAGILLHPDDVFTDRPRLYGTRPLALFEPQRPAELEPAADGDPLGVHPAGDVGDGNPKEAELHADEKAG